MALTFGRTPDALTVYLTPAAPLQATLASQDGAGAPVDWPAGASLTLELLRAGTSLGSYPFTLTGPHAQLTLDLAAIGALPKVDLKARLWLDYADGNGRFLWCLGKAVWSG